MRVRHEELIKFHKEHIETAYELTLNEGQILDIAVLLLDIKDPVAREFAESIVAKEIIDEILKKLGGNDGMNFCYAIAQPRELTVKNLALIWNGEHSPTLNPTTGNFWCVCISNGEILTKALPVP